ncbi:hypothetical protein OUZ56_032731 [Daphnia magna]|uniref:Uncharacterized protein n=1 Tax=Daphnia magna TaxID=35525 RepID=A0ABQ9ZWY5_9CRUS|nr:hypothetical protein OUZ56_032731 [Daphnia magna]
MLKATYWRGEGRRQLGLRETVSKGRDRHRYIPVGLFRPSDWLSPSPHPKAPPPLLLVFYCLGVLLSPYRHDRAGLGKCTRTRRLAR